MNTKPSKSSGVSKNTRRAAMDAEKFDWKCFRFADDGRSWRPLARERRAYFVKAANSADQDGTRVEISAQTFMKAGGERATAFRRLRELSEMGACLHVLHKDRDGQERELKSSQGVKVRRLLYDSLEAAQRVLDAGQEFLGHSHLSDAEQLAIQRGWLCSGAEKWQEDTQKNSQPASDDVSSSPDEISTSPNKVSGSPNEVSGSRLHDRKVLTEKEKPNQSSTGGMDDDSSENPAGKGREIQKATSSITVRNLAEAFIEVTGKPFKAGAEHKASLSGLVRSDGPVILSAVVAFAKDSHDWTQVKSPAAMFLKQSDDYLSVAKTEDRQKRSRELAEQEGQRCVEEHHRAFKTREAEMLQQRAEEEAQAAQVGPNGEGLFD